MMSPPGNEAKRRYGYGTGKPGNVVGRTVRFSRFGNIVRYGRRRFPAVPARTAAFRASLRRIKEKKGGVVGPPNSQLILFLAFSIFSNENEVDFLPFF
jgi:hypothetical protein